MSRAGVLIGQGERSASTRWVEGMSLSPLLSSGLQGFHSATQGMQGAAQKIVHAGVEVKGSEPVSVEESVVDLKVYQRSAEASAKVVKTADEVLGTLLDVLA